MSNIKSSIWKKIFSNNYFFIILIAAILSISIIQNYRFVKDDTGNIVSFYFLIKTMDPLRLLDYFASNEWLSYQPRSFFLTWWIQIGLIKLFGMQDLFGALTTSFAIFASVIHALNAILIYWICKKLQIGIIFPIILALFYLIMPTASMDYMISNNWFFLIPLFFCLCYSALLVNRVSKVSTGIFEYFTLFILLLCIMFSGEQLMVIPYLLLAVAIVNIYFKKDINRVKRRNLILQYIGLILAGLFSYIIYIKVYAAGPKIVLPAGSLTKNIFDIPSLISINTFSVLLEYTISTLEFILKFCNIRSDLYGGNAVNFSFESVGLASLATVIFISCIWSRTRKIEELKKYKFINISLFFLLLFFSSMLAMYFGAISGNRPGPDDRYLMAPTLISMAFIIYCIQCLVRSNQVITILLAPFFFYGAILVFHLNIDVWENQRKLDMRLWAVTNKLAGDNVKYILTINNDTYFAHRGLQRPYLSAAWSDFNADWGVTPRIKYEANKEVRLIHNIIINKDGGLTAIGYWGDKIIIKNDEIHVVYFNDGPTMLSAINGEVSVMDLQGYLNAVQTTNIPNRVLR